jgi:hypothetical protein
MSYAHLYVQVVTVYHSIITCNMAHISVYYDSSIIYTMYDYCANCWQYCWQYCGLVVYWYSTPTANLTGFSNVDAATCTPQSSFSDPACACLITSSLNSTHWHTSYTANSLTVTCESAGTQVTVTCMHCCRTFLTCKHAAHGAHVAQIDAITSMLAANTTSFSSLHVVHVVQAACALTAMRCA